MEISGGCLCGAVRYQGDAEPVYSLKCYCTDCRRVSATGHGAFIGVPKEAVKVAGPVTTYVKKADSGNETARSFCPSCGAGIHAHLAVVPDLLFFRASTLDDVSIFKPDVAFYASRAPAWDAVNEGLQAFPTVPPRNG